jgi:PncC family amidohydrolase
MDQPQIEPAEIALNRLLVPPVPFMVATAESCTGGGVASRIVSVSGCSEYMLGGIVSYSNDAKHRLLGVPEEILNTVGAVSPECAEAMATGACRAFGAGVAVSTTGIAGPGGATSRKPVGLVYFGLATPAGVSSYEHHFPGDRATVIAAATETALQLLLRGVRETLDG